MGLSSRTTPDTRLWCVSWITFTFAFPLFTFLFALLAFRLRVLGALPIILEIPRRIQSLSFALALRRLRSFL